MHRFVAPTIAVLLKALLALATTTAVAQNIPGAAARVNGVEISNFRLERHFEEYLRSKRRNVSAMINPKVYKNLKREALDQLIERELLWQAARADGKVATDAEVQSALQEIATQTKGGRDAYLRRLAQAGFDEASYAEYVRQEMSGLAWLARRASATSPVSDADVEAAYQANLSRFQRPESVRAQHILLKVAPAAPADAHAAARTALAKIRAEAAAGANFGDLARKYCPGLDCGLRRRTRRRDPRPDGEALRGRPVCACTGRGFRHRADAVRLPPDPLRVAAAGRGQIAGRCARLHPGGSSGRARRSARPRSCRRAEGGRPDRDPGAARLSSE